MYLGDEWLNQGDGEVSWPKFMTISTTPAHFLNPKNPATSISEIFVKQNFLETKCLAKGRE